MLISMHRNDHRTALTAALASGSWASLALLGLLATTAAPRVQAQGGSYLSFGNGCTGSLGLPTLLGSRPAIGQTLQIDVSSAPGLVVVLFGGSNTVWAGGSLPFDLGLLGAPGCPLLVSPDASVSATAVGGVAQVLVPVPNLGTLVGGVFYNQGLLLDPAANPLGLTSSNGACATVGAANGGGLGINSVSNPNPPAGQTIVVRGVGFGLGCCVPGFFPLGPASGGQVQLLTAHVPNPGAPFQLEAANLTSFVPLGPRVPGGQPFAPVPGVRIPPTAFGGVGTLPAGGNAGQGIGMNIGQSGSPIQLPVTLDPLGRICIDFAGTNWTGNETLEVELHFDTTGTFIHCDFFAVDIDFTTPGSAAQCAAIAGFWITLQLATDPNCQGFQVSVQGTKLYLAAPAGAGTITNLHPFSHVKMK